ncbi:DUF5689 domain-containing protein [Sphingobacterium arenae]|uniref:BACON domain-containing protein n=1 Tax=Sphingobacterium arenae TaxID=1280598 RepID=A0ABR7Y5A8_9SPHI|nr:DUF5689 domain-containing protein [Sphingobacterium arenae]MBD1426476.1 BACON domain-containing protein [Sphingobacterium arenae]
MMMNKKYEQQILSKIFLVISTLFFLMTMGSCSKELEAPDTLEIENLSPVVRAAAGTLSIDVLSNTSWKMGKTDATWLTVENTAGTGNGQLHLAYDENNTVDPRTVEFFIVTTKDGKYHKIELTQLATDPILELDQEEIEVGSRSRTHEIKLNTNIPAAGISIEVLYEEEEGSNWIAGINVGAETLTFQTALNTIEEERVATIILSYGNTSNDDVEDVWSTITVTQMASGNDGPPELRDFDYVKELPLGVIDENISVMGNIVSTGVSDNFRKNTYIIQDENSSAFAFEAIGSLPLNQYDKVHLLLDGASIETFEDGGTSYRVIKNISAANVLTREPDPSFSPKKLRINELTDDHVLALVILQDVEFAIPHGGYSNFHEYYTTQSYADYATKHYPAPIRDIQGDNMYLITNRAVTYRRNSVPKGSGAITGLVVKVLDSAYGDLGEYSIRHLKESAIAIDPNQANGFSNILVEWELGPTTGFPNGTPNLPPTTGPTNATLQKDEGTGFYASNTLNGIYLIDKYRGDKSGANTVISNSSYNVNSWGTGRYWIMDNVSTLGITSSLSLQFEAVSVSSTGSGGGPRDFAVEYSLDGENWSRIANYQITGQIAANQVQNVTAGLKMFTYKLPNELLNKPNIKIRLMNINNTSVNGGNIAIPGSTSRLGHFSIKYNK